MSINETPNDSFIPLTERKVVRRGIIAGIAGFGAAALVKVAGAGKAEADAAATLTGPSTAAYGLIGSPGTPQVPVSPVLGATIHGVIGSNSSTAVLPIGSGVAGARNGTGTAGVLGVNASDGMGVYGVSQSSAGVQGFSTSGVGLRGIPQGFVGLVGISSASIGLYGYTTAQSVPAFYAENLSGPGTSVAGYFYGDVTVEGNFTVTGAKHAAVPMPDGSEAVVYCQESPEPYFEDFGRGQLANGIANIDLERDFASIVRREDYMVFITPGGDSKGLYVSRQTPQGFEVREAQGGKSSLPFTYRIVAKRKDIEGKRLARIDPKIKGNLAAMRANAAAKQSAAPLGQRNGTPGAGTPLVPIGPDLGSPRPGPER
jgi:hypothetical protein